jgi:serine/threonine protein phosphatase PrpC
MIAWTSLQNQGSRKYMEDEFILVPKFYKDFDLAAVFDGHGGSYVSEFCAKNIQTVLLRCINQSNGNIRKALVQCFHDLDDELDVTKSRSTGSTCLVILCDGKNQMWVANAGDSRAVMSKSKSSCIILSKDHKPDFPAERKRIEDNGGFILNYGVWRVNGELAVSRSIGDKKYRPLVIATPDVKRVRIDPKENSMLILATDGLWDVVKNTQAIRVATHAHRNKTSICKALLQKAMDNNMEDNITILVGTI